MTRAIKVSPKSHFEYRRRRRLRRPQRRFLSNDCCLLSRDCNDDDRRRPISRFSFEVPQQNTVVFWATGTRLPGGHKKEFHIKNTYYPFMALVLCSYDIELQFRWWIADILYFGHFLPISIEIHLTKKISGFLVNFTFVQLFFLSLIRFEDDLLKYLCQPV